jgi:hypothetical protein
MKFKDRVGSLEADLKNLPDLIRDDVRTNESRRTRRLYSLETQMHDFRTRVDQRFDAMITELVQEEKK